MAVGDIFYITHFAYRQRPREKMRRIRIAVICGGMLRVITPLYKMLTLSPTQNRLAVSVCTMTSCGMEISLTSKLFALTSRTIAIIRIIFTPPVVIWI